MFNRTARAWTQLHAMPGGAASAVDDEMAPTTAPAPAPASASLMEQYHPQQYIWEVNSWAEPEGGYMIWPCCRALAEDAPGCQQRTLAEAPPAQAHGEHTHTTPPPPPG